MLAARRSLHNGSRRTHQRSLARRSQSTRNHRRYFSTAPLVEEDGIVLRSFSLTYPKVREIKRERFGRELELFKKEFEKPYMELFDKIACKKALAKKSVIRKAKKRGRSEMREKAEKAKLEEKKQEILEELRQEDELKDAVAKGPVELADFTMGVSEEMRPFNPALNPSSPLAKFARYGQVLHNWERFVQGRTAGWAFLPEYLRGASENPFSIQYPANVEWQLALPKLELVKYVAKQMREDFAINVPDDIAVYTSIAEKLMPGAHQLGKKIKEKPRRGVKPIYTGTLDAYTLKDEYTGEPFVVGDVTEKEPVQFEDLDPESPFIKVKAKIARGITRPDDIQKLTPDRPIAITSWHVTNWPVNDKARYKFHTRKAVLTVALRYLNLPLAVRNRLQALAGKRYDPKTGILKISMSKRSTFEQNKNLAIATFKAFLSEAWKADLNYVPRATDPIEPIKRLELQSYLENQQKEEAEEYDPKNFREPNVFTTFRVAWFPLEDIADRRERARKLVAEIAPRLVASNVQ